MTVFLIMFQQFIASKIIFQIPDHRVNMIGVVLGIVVLDWTDGAAASSQRAHLSTALGRAASRCSDSVDGLP